MTGPAARMSAADFFRLLRPTQWTKNLLVLAAFIFAYGDRARTAPLALADLARVIPAMLAFCLISSGIYVFNDILDAEMDRRHPVKKLRAIAAGRVPLAVAGLYAVVLLAGGAIAAAWLSPRLGLTAAAYVALQLVYSLGLKRAALVDILVIAAGFVLRAIAGAVVLRDVTISPWLLLCTFLLALFLALCKRRHEKIQFEDAETHDTRPSLDHYDRQLLDQLIGIVAAATIVSYSIYTLWPETVHKFGTHALGFTIPFVVFGVFRYLDLVYRHDKGDRPEKILLTDFPLLVDLALYGLTVFAVFHLGTP